MKSNVMDELRDAFFAVDHNWYFTYLNPAAEKLLQRNKEDLLGKCLWGEFKEAIGTRFYKQYHKALESKIVVEFEDKFEPLNKWFDVRAYPYESGIAVHFRDINNRKKALEESREHYKSLFDQNPDAVFSFDLDGNYMSANKSFENLLGYTMDEYVKMNFEPLVVPEDLEKTHYHFQKAAEGVLQTYEVTTLTKNGERVEVTVTNVPIVVDGEIVGVYGIAKDITKHKRVEQEIKESEASLKQALHIAKLGSWSWDLRTDVLVWSDAMYRMFGMKPTSEVTFEIFLKYVHPEDRDLLVKTIDKTMKGTPLNVQFRIVRPNGQIRYVEILGETFFDENGYALKIIGTTQDVTERKFEQERLRRSEELYKLISENSQDIILYTTPGGVINYVSPAIYNVLGYRPDELIGSTRKDLFHPEDLQRIDRKSLKEKEVFDIRVRHSNGHYSWIEASIKVIKNEFGETEKILAIGRDISERIEAKELMIKSEKLTMAGQLAAGIAHEIRNPLTAIKGFLQMMQRGYDMQKEYLDVMDSELVRIEFILNELLLLAKPTEKKLEQKDLNSIVSHVVKLLETEANFKNVIFKTTLHGEGLYINCDENQLKQIFINFVKNGIEAMPDGGEINISTYIEDENSIICFKDQGCGIPKEKLANIGQPFFTTKEKGTGLGLAVSFSIIENHRGEVIIDSEVGKGTTIKVKVPLLN